MWGSIPGPQDHDLSQRQMLNDWATQAPTNVDFYFPEWLNIFMKLLGFCIVSHCIKTIPGMRNWVVENKLIQCMPVIGTPSPLFIYSLLSNLCTQCGLQTHNPETVSDALLTEPARCPIFLLLFRNKIKKIVKVYRIRWYRHTHMHIYISIFSERVFFF